LTANETVFLRFAALSHPPPGTRKPQQDGRIRHIPPGSSTYPELAFIYVLVALGQRDRVLIDEVEQTE